MKCRGALLRARFGKCRGALLRARCSGGNTVQSIGAVLKLRW